MPYPPGSDGSLLGTAAFPLSCRSRDRIDPIIDHDNRSQVILIISHILILHRSLDWFLIALLFSKVLVLKVEVTGLTIINQKKLLGFLSKEC